MRAKIRAKVFFDRAPGAALFIAAASLLLAARVTGAAVATTHRFQFEQGTVVQTGGFAGVHETYSIEGRFRLSVDLDAGVASFVTVDANLVGESPYLYTASLNELFNMTGLSSTAVSETSISFEGPAGDGMGSTVALTLTFTGGSVHLAGHTIPPPGSADFYVFELDAAATAIAAPVTTTYRLIPDPDAIRTSGGIHGGGHGSFSTEGTFRLTVDQAAGTAQFDAVSATISGPCYYFDDTTHDIVTTQSLGELFRMTRLESTDVNDAAIHFELERDYPGFPSADITAKVTFDEGQAQLEAYFCHPVIDGYCYHLDTTATVLTGPVVLYVDADAPGNNDGSSWEDAYDQVYDALKDAESRKKPVEIRVAQGVYRPEQITIGSPPQSIQMTQPFQLISGVALRGGYAGYGETAPDRRDVKLCETILSGDMLGNDAGVADPCELLDEPTRSDNAECVVTAYLVDGTAILDGFTVAGGHHKLMCILPCGGAGMGCHGASPTIINCTFRANAALDSGGAMFNGADSEPRIVNCLFEGNYAGSGGAVANYDNGTGPTLRNCAFIGNRSHSGGAMSSQRHTRFTLINCTFAGNVAENCRALAYSRIKQSTVKNCILWDGGDEMCEDADSVVEVAYSNVQGGWPGEGTVDVDPLFAADGDCHLKSQAGRWDASSGRWVQDDVTSPCIDAGDPMTPIGLEPFPNGGIVNMGAYGGTAEASKSWFGGPVCETVVAGDVNGDCIVDFRDLASITMHWLEDNRSVDTPSDGN